MRRKPYIYISIQSRATRSNSSGFGAPICVCVCVCARVCPRVADGCFGPRMRPEAASLDPLALTCSSLGRWLASNGAASNLIKLAPNTATHSDQASEQLGADLNLKCHF